MHNFSYAGFWIRLAAFFIDALLVTILFLVCVIILGVDMTADGNSNDTAILDVLNIVIGWGYYIAFMGSNMQATPGKYILGMKVIRSDGSRITYLRALGRTVATIISYLTLMIGFIMAAFSAKKQTLHDKIADTVRPFKIRAQGVD